MTSQRAGCQTMPLASMWRSSKQSCALQQVAMSTVSSVPSFTMHLHHRLHLTFMAGSAYTEVQLHLVASAS